MKLSTLLAAAFASAIHAQVEMDRLMELKTKHWDEMRANGVFNRYDNARVRPAGPAPCVNGKAGEYSCDKVNMLSFLSHAEMGSTTKEGNDIWGNLTRLYRLLRFTDMTKAGLLLTDANSAPWARPTAPLSLRSIQLESSSIAVACPLRPSRVHGAI